MAIDVETVEKGPEAAPESAEPTPEAPQNDASAVEPVVAAEEAPVVEPAGEPVAVAAPDYDAILRDPAFLESAAGKKFKADAEHAGAQRKETEFRKQAGSTEFAESATLNILKRGFGHAGVDFDPDLIPAKDLTEWKRTVGYIAEANRDVIRPEVVMEAANQFEQVILGDDVQLPQAVIEKANAVLRQNDAQGNPNWGGYYRELEDARVESRVQARTAELEADFEKRLSQRVTEELKAKGAEEGRANGITPPASPRGGGTASGLTWDAINQKYTDSQWMALPASERARMTDEANGNGR